MILVFFLIYNCEIDKNLWIITIFELIEIFPLLLIWKEKTLVLSSLNMMLSVVLK